MRHGFDLAVGLLSVALCGTVALADGGDSDGDGIADTQDLCPGTAPGANVWKSGEWIGCAGGQTRIASGVAEVTFGRNQVMDAIERCEDSLSGQFGSRQIYRGSSCEQYAYRQEDATRGYIAIGRADLGTPAVRMSIERLRYRLSACLNTNRQVALIFDQMDRSGCSPYATTYGGGSSYGGGATTRVPQPSTPSNGSTATGYYRSGVSYTTSGNVAFGSNGTTYTTSGNVTFGSDGTTYTRSGNVTFGSDGTTYIRSGNVTFGSNGTTCITSGNVTTCS